MLVAAVATTGAVVLGVAASGGTYAFLRSSATAGSAVLKAATADLALTTGLTLSTTALYPGSAAAQGSAVVKNTGTIPLVLRVNAVTLTGSATAFSAALVVQVSVVEVTGTCPGSSPVTVAVPSGTPVDLGTQTVAPQASKKICVAAVLPITAPAGANNAAPASFAVVLDGRQV